MLANRGARFRKTRRTSGRSRSIGDALLDNNLAVLSGKETKMANEQTRSESQSAVRKLTMRELDVVTGGRGTNDPLYPFPPQPSPTFPPVEP